MTLSNNHRQCRQAGKTRFNPILFDLDGTLINSANDIAQSINQTLIAFDMAPLELGQIISFVGDGVRRLVARTLNRYDKTVDVEGFIIRFREIYRERCLETTRPFSGIRSLLATAAASAKLGVVTNKPGALARYMLAQMNLDRHFSVVIGGGEAPLKPLPDPLQIALQRLQLDAANGLMVGDHKNDILAAEGAGLQTCGVTWGFDGGEMVRQSNPDFLCDDVETLTNLLLLP